MTETTNKRPISMCAICNKRIYLSPGRGGSSGWVHGEVFGIARMIQVHHECYFDALDRLQEKGDSEVFPETGKIREK